MFDYCLDMRDFSSADRKFMIDLMYLNVMFLYSNESPQVLKEANKMFWLRYLHRNVRGMSL